MTDQFVESLKTAKPIRLLLLLAMLLPFVASTPAANAAMRVQPELLQMAAQRPNTMVNVIVQKLGQGEGVDQMVTKLGGTVTKDLHIINAFSAEMPATPVATLGKASGARCI